MTELNRLRWQCRRGQLELDLLLTGFLERRWGALSDFERTAFARLLRYPDEELWGWLQGVEPAPDPELRALVAQL